jgi:hypothetical protein
MRRVFFPLAAAMFVAPMQSPAQTPSGTSVLSGRVTQAGDTTIGVGGADIEILGTALRRSANGEGRFRFADIEPGSYALRVRSIGYQTTSLSVLLVQGRTTQVNVELRRFPNALTEVRIEGRIVKVPARFEGVYARAAKGEGKFFTREDIDRLNPYDVLSLLSLVPTVYTNDGGVRFERCRPGVQAEKVQVYIDGTRMTALASTSVSEALRLVHPRDIQAMEVYTGVARLPAEFVNDACAVIAIWTKSY